MIGKRYIACLAGILAFMATLAAHPADSVRVSLMTCAPGQEIYSLFGHTAIRYEDPVRGIDVVFNYGMFSFDTPNFVGRFVKGETDYRLGVTEYPYFSMEYAMRGSAVYQQTLNLAPEEKLKLWEILEENYRPENRVYRYNFFFDNCTTRARDKIEECINGTVLYEESNRSLSFRDIVHEYTAGFPWSELGIDLCIGRDADRIANEREQMFAPFYLLHALDSAKIVSADGQTVRTLVERTEQVLPDGEKACGASFPFTPLQTFWTLFGIVLILSVYGIRKNRRLWGLDAVLFGLTGLAGCVIAFLVFFSVHPTVNCNYMLILFNPIPLIYLPVMIYLAIKKKKDYYHGLNLVVLTFFILLWEVIPQKINPAVLPLALCLLIRSASNLIIAYKHKE